jgi:glycerol uptake facilitator protein
VKQFLGEMMGTFLLVFIGCGSLALFSGQPWLIAFCWGAGVTLAIFLTRDLSGAQLNPAISCTLLAAGKQGLNKLPVYLFGQFLGAFLAAAVLFTMIKPVPSLLTAKIFADYYAVAVPLAFWAEFAGTFVLATVVLALVSPKNVPRNLVPFLIGITVSLIILVIGPLTMAGINPARDFGPRLFTYWFGFGSQVFIPGSFSVYVFAPILGGITAALIFRSRWRCLLIKIITSLYGFVYCLET